MQREDYEFTNFPDGRAIVQSTDDGARARGSMPKILWPLRKNGINEIVL